MPNRSAPPGSVVPVLQYPDVAAAADWLCRTFGFRVRLRIGTHRVQLVRDGTALVVHELRSADGTSPPGAGARSDDRHEVLLRVADVDAQVARAEAAGAQVVQAPSDHPYGERQAAVLDVGGHRWTLTQSIADVDPLDWGATDVDLDP